MAAPRRRGPHKLCKHLISTFYKTTNAPAPPLLCLVRNRRGRGGRGETGHTLIFVPLFVQSFVVVVVIIFLCWRRNTIEPRERKTGHVKTGYFHDNERKQHHIHGGREGGGIQRSLVLVMLSVFTAITSSHRWNMNLASSFSFSRPFSPCSVGSWSVSSLTLILQSLTT